MLKIEKAHAMADAQSAVTQNLQPRWLRPEAAAHYAGLSRARLYEELSSGRLKSHRVGGCRLIDRLVLDAFIESHPDQD